MTKTCVSTTATRPHLARLISAIALPLPQDNNDKQMNAYSRFAVAQLVGEPFRHGA